MRQRPYNSQSPLEKKFPEPHSKNQTHSIIKAVVTDGLQRTRTATPALPLAQMEKLRPQEEEVAGQGQTTRKTEVPTALHTPQSQGEASHNTPPAEEKNINRKLNPTNKY